MILVNGQPSEQLPISDRGLQYGDGVWETLRIKDHQAIFLKQHLERLSLGLQCLMIHTLDIAALKSEIQQLCKINAQAILKIIISRGSGGRGYSSAGISVSATRILSLHPLPKYPKSYQETGIKLTLCQTRLAHNPALAGFKHLNRLEQVMARSELGDNYQEGVVRDYAGNIIEGTMSNLFIIKDNTIYTPELDHCGIRGIMQAYIKQLLQQNNIPFIQTPLSLETLFTADAIFMSNSIIGIWSVQSFTSHDKIIQYSQHPLIQKLQYQVEPYR